MRSASQPTPTGLAAPATTPLHRLGRQARSLPGRLLIGLVQLYRLAVSPVLAPSCRYWPSCSEYAIEALRRHGAARGSWLAARRLCRCHPWSAGGIDEVPAPGTGDPAIARNSRNLENSQKPLTRWRAPFGEPYRDQSDTASS